MREQGGSGEGLYFESGLARGPEEKSRKYQKSASSPVLNDSGRSDTGGSSYSKVARGEKKKKNRGRLQSSKGGGGLVLGEPPGEGSFCAENPACTDEQKLGKKKGLECKDQTLK